MPNIEVIDAADALKQLALTEPAVKAAEDTWVSPLDVLFSQNVIYPRFTDGRLVDDSVKAIQVVEKDAVPGEAVALEAPFPAIEVVRWSPKLRDGQGRPLEDGEGGHRRGKEGLFTLDNRRLYALQRAAVAQWPRPTRVLVKLVVDRIEIARHAKKFRTRTNGLSVTISEWNGVGRDNAKDYAALRVWDWRCAVSASSDVAGGATGSRAVAAADTGSCGSWEYLDNQDVRRGPFSNWQMRQWWERQMFPSNLRVRPYDAAVAAQAVMESGGPADTGGEPFRPVLEVFAWAPSPFAADWSPPTTQATAEWRTCAECQRSRLDGWSGRGRWYCVTCWKRWEKQPTTE